MDKDFLSNTTHLILPSCYV